MRPYGDESKAPNIGNIRGPERRSQTGCSVRRMPADFHHGQLDSRDRPLTKELIHHSPGIMNSFSGVFPAPLSSRLGLSALVTVMAVTTAGFAQQKAKPAEATPPAAAPAAKAFGAAPAQAAASTVPEQKYKTNLKGQADAPIRVVEFADFMCPGCQTASMALRAYFAQQGPDINLTFKNFPLEQTCNPGIGRTIHNGACELALGGICASELGAFWAYHDRIFSRSWESATRQDAIDNGVAVGLNKAKLEACMGSSEAKSKLALQVKEGFETVVQVTPTLVVNGKKLEATNQFANVVEQERKKLAAEKK